MKVTKSRRLTVRMGNYESVEIYAGVELQPEEVTVLTAEVIDETLDRLMVRDVEDASFQTAFEESFIHQHHKEMTERIN